MTQDTLQAASDEKRTEMIALTTEIVSAFVRNNSVDASELPTLISEVHSSLSKLSSAQAFADGQQPAVPITESITDEFLICLEDGKEFKSLKRHLRTKYQLSPEQYREKWGLPYDYPMVAPAYARQRSELAKQMGLGQGKVE